MTDSALRRSRRAKMAELQRQLDPSSFDESAGHTSAPSVRQVDQFRERYGQADQRERSPREPLAKSQGRKRILLYAGGSRVRKRLLL